MQDCRKSSRIRMRTAADGDGQSGKTAVSQIATITSLKKLRSVQQDMADARAMGQQRAYEDFTQLFASMRERMQGRNMAGIAQSELIERSDRSGIPINPDLPKTVHFVDGARSLSLALHPSPPESHRPPDISATAKAMPTYRAAPWLGRGTATSAAAGFEQRGYDSGAGPSVRVGMVLVPALQLSSPVFYAPSYSPRWTQLAGPANKDSGREPWSPFAGSAKRKGDGLGLGQEMGLSLPPPELQTYATTAMASLYQAPMLTPMGDSLLNALRHSAQTFPTPDRSAYSDPGNEEDPAQTIRSAISRGESGADW